MVTKISGTVEDANGNSIQGATIYVVRGFDDTVVATTTTDSVGAYEVTGLESTNTYHVAAQYNDGSTVYAGESYPFIEPYTDTGPIDDFERDDIDPYTGEKTSFNTQTIRVQEGSVALEMGNDDGSNHEIRSTSGLPRYPDKGATFSFRIYFDNTQSSGAFLFGVQDSDNYYRAQINPSNGEISLSKREGGILSDIGTASVSIPTAEWLEGVIVWGNSDMTLTLNDSGGNELGSTPAGSDEVFTSGGVGWIGSVESFSEDSVYYDIATITDAAGITFPIVIDDFEDGDVAEYSGDTGAVTVQTTTVKSGEDAAEISAGQNEIRSFSGLNDYPEQGDVFAFNHHFGDGAIPRFLFGVQDADNYYRVELDSSASEMRLVKRDGGAETVLDSTAIAFDLNAWVETSVEWRTNGKMVVEHFDSTGTSLGSVDAKDTAWSSGGVGWGEWSV